MASFADSATIASNGSFQARVNFALITAAVNVYAEGSSIASHAARSAFAVRVFGGAFNINTIGLMVMTNATISAESSVILSSLGTVLSSNNFAIPDGDIQFAVNSLWNDMAGV